MENNESITSRISNFENLGFGLFMHYGLYSQVKRGEWIQWIDKIPASEYAPLINTFNADGFNPRETMAYAKKAGMKYAVLTTRHHEGFSLYDTKGLSDFDVMHSPVGKDLIRIYVDACNEFDIIPFFYHTTIDWHDERYYNRTDFDGYIDYLHKSIELLCTNYGKIGGFWFDGNWDAPNENWRADEMYEIIRKHQPDCIIANNPGIGFAGKIYGQEEDVICFEQGAPDVIDSGNTRLRAKEMSQTINSHWAFWAKDTSYKSVNEIIKMMCYCRSKGSNYLLNLTPNDIGNIPTIQKGMLEIIGDFTKEYAKSFYNGKPLLNFKSENEDFAVKTKDGEIYIFAYDFYENDPLYSVNGVGTCRKTYTGITSDIKSICWADNNEKLEFSQDKTNNSVSINETNFKDGTCFPVRVMKLCI
ncbi:MAG: alpha-L-fucosidase [Clostridia bacterium]